MPSVAPALDAAAAQSAPGAEATTARRERLARHVTVGERRILLHALRVLQEWPQPVALD